MSLPSYRASQLSNAKFITALFEKVQRMENAWQGDTHGHHLAELQEYLGAANDHSDDKIRRLAMLRNQLSPGMTRESFLALFVPLEREWGKSLIDHDFLVTYEDRNEPPAVIHPLTIVVDNLRSAFNVGAIFRTADCLGATEVILTGYTATPVNERVRKTAMGSDNSVKWRWVSHVAQIISELHQRGIATIALETFAENSDNLFDFKFPHPCALIVGNERYGLSPDAINLCQHRLSIPVFGIKNSLNVGIATAACGYEIIRQWSSK